MNTEVMEVSVVLPGGRSVAGLRMGSTSGVPVLALHGWLDNAMSFVPLAPWLDSANVLAMDHAGHGASEPRGAGSLYTFLEYVEDVLSVADSLGWARFSLLGHSLGAAVALAVAGVAPGRIERVALIDGLGPAVTEPGEFPGALRRTLTVRAAGVRGSRTFPTVAAAVDRMLEVRTPLARSSAELIASRGLCTRDAGVAFVHDPRLHLPSLQRLTEDQVCALLAEVTAPVLLFRPQHGWPVPHEVVARRMGLLAMVSVVEVPGGHHVHMDAPEVVGPPLRAFLTATEAR